MARSAYQAEFKGIRNFILGKESPHWFTQIVVLIGLFTWIWFFLSNLFGILAIRFVKISDEQHIRDNFDNIGMKYGLTDVMDLYSNMSFLGIAGSVLMIVGLLFVWRKWLAGYYMFLGGILTCILSPVIFMSYEYLKNEQEKAEYLLPLCVVILFVADLYIVQKRKSI